MSALGSCPVCFLDLRPGIPLNVHLDTHPKEMIVSALMNALQQPSGRPTTPYADQTIATTATLPPSNLAQRNVEYRSGESFRSGSSSFYLYQSPQHLQPTNSTDDCPPVMACYTLDSEDNLVEEGLPYKEEKEEAISNYHAESATNESEEYIKTENHELRTEDDAGENDEHEEPEPSLPPPTNTLRGKMSATILSVSVLDPKDNITWVSDEHNRLSPNAVLPSTVKRGGTSIPSTSQVLGTSQSDIRPVATSVIRTCHPETNAIKVGEQSFKTEQKQESPTSPLPSTSGTQLTQLTQPKSWKSTNTKTPKILKVTFKKPPLINADPCSQPSTSKEPVAIPAVVDTRAHADTISGTSTDLQASPPTTLKTADSPVPLDERPASSEHITEASGGRRSLDHQMHAGMMQLKAGACEEVFISQHSLIKMEQEGEDDYGDMSLKQYDRSAMNDSKESVEEEELVMASSSRKVFVDLHESKSLHIEELCLSESSSVCSMMHGVVERMNVNIRAEEAMPAKGEISEQESNADSEMLWHGNAIEDEASVARESWNFGHANSCDNLTFNGIPKLSSMCSSAEEEEEDDDEDEKGTFIKVEPSTFQCLDEDDEAIAGPSDVVNARHHQPTASLLPPGPSSFAEQLPSSSGMSVGLMATASSSSSKTPSSERRTRPYRCPGCPESFRLFRQRKDHIIAHHEELLSKKQRYMHMKKIGKFEMMALEQRTGEVEGGSSGTGGGAGVASHFGTPETFTRRVEQLSVIKLHRFLIEYNLKALKETAGGRREELRTLLVEFSQRRIYFCTDCLQQFPTMREYRKHMVLHPVRCFTCVAQGEKRPGGGGEVKVEEESVVLLVKKEKEEDVILVEEGHQEEMPATEGSTNLTFWNWRSFVEHQKVHLGVKEMNTCTKCNKSFSTRRKLNLHTSSVHRRKAYHCTFCPRTFMQFFRLKEHKKRHHFNFNQKVTVSHSLVPGAQSGQLARQKDYLCPCGEVFHSAAKFAWHKETHEKQPKGCMFCRERFVHKNSLSRHIRLAHPDKYSDFKQDTLPCPICKARFIPTSLKVHIASHVKRAEFQCSICNKVLSTKWNLKIHRWTHNSRSQMPFKCPTCPKAFMRANDLQVHQNTHKAIRPFTCDYCGCQFSRKYNWVRHTREHELEKKFSCSQCGKSFHRSYYLKEHLRSHTNERPFECTICGKTSTTKTNHNKHLKIHHARDVTATEG